MAKQRLPKRELAPKRLSSSPQDLFQAQVQTLLKQQKYRQALEEIQKAQRSQPDLIATPSEAEIWLLRGKQEFQKRDVKQAESSLRRSLQLGIKGESHYWLAKCLLARNLLDAAIALIRPVFEDGSLPKDYSICYPKLLLLKGDTATVEQLLTQDSKRFPAAQQHWLRGVLALKAQQPAAALESFQKVKQPVTPSDCPHLWQIYAQQLLQNWEAAAQQLGISTNAPSLRRFPFAKPLDAEHPMLQRLALLQHIQTGQPPLEDMTFSLDSRLSSEIIDVLTILEFIEENNPHEAAHTLLKLDRRLSKFPELATLRPALLTLAGQQSLTQGEMQCAAEFWQLLQREQPFNPQLAVNLMKALDLTQNYPELQRLLTRLIKWLEQEFKQHPQNWPEERRKITLAYAHCRLSDTWIMMGRGQAGMGELQTAERIHPGSPEVKGRHGLTAFAEQRYDEAAQLLSQALEEGCRYGEVYTALVDTWKTLGNPEAAATVRRRFGSKFGDLNPEMDVEVPPWVDALSTRSYPLFSNLVQAGSDLDPPLRACQIFVDAARGVPNSGGKVSLDQAQAVQQWDGLLQGLLPKAQVPTLQAIDLCLLLFAKREKGIAALITQYMLKLVDLEAEQPDAHIAHLVILSLRERDPQKLEIPFQFHLGRMPQPGNALAQIQLQVRRYAQNLLQAQILRSFIEDALSREPQNPLLLLAKATTYPNNSAQYEQLKQQGFEIARRLQDAKALKSFREEQAFLDTQEIQQFLPNPAALENFELSDMDDMLEGMIRKLLGSKVPPAELKRMLPELKQMFFNTLPAFDDFEEDEDDDFGFGFGFGGPPPLPKKPSRRKRR